MPPPPCMQLSQTCFIALPIGQSFIYLQFEAVFFDEIVEKLEKPKIMICVVTFNGFRCYYYFNAVIEKGVSCLSIFHPGGVLQKTTIHPLVRETRWFRGPFFPFSFFPFFSFFCQTRAEIRQLTIG